MRSKWYRQLFSACGGVLLLLAAFTAGRAQEVKLVLADSVRAESVSNNPKPFRNDTIRVALNVDLSALSAPDNRLRDYQATLRWNQNVMQFLNTTPALAPWDTPSLNLNEVAAGKIEWNDFVNSVTGTSGKINLLNLNFKIIGNPGDSTILNLNFTTITNSLLRSLLPILVTKNGNVIVQNRPPNIADLAPQTMNENATLNVAAAATDPENGKIKFRVVNLPAFGVFTDNNNNTAAIRFTPDFSAAGVYPKIMVIASDDGIPIKSDTTTFALTVNNVNRPPKITPLPAQITIDEGAVTEIPLSATDPDGDKITLRNRNLPAFAALLDNGNGTGVLRFTPGRDAAGNYLNLKVFATDNGVPPLSDSTQANLTVNNILSPLDSVRAESVPNNPKPFRNDTIRVAINVDLSALSAPDNRLRDYQATLNWNKNVIQFLNTTFAPAPWDTPSLNLNEVAAGKIEWNDFVNSTTGTSGKINLLNLNFKVVGNPGDSTILDLNFTTITNSMLMSLLRILVTKDGNVVVQGNRPPDIADIPDQMMNEGATLELPVTAKDPDNDKLTLTAKNLPAFAVLTDKGNGTGTLRFKPGRNDSGDYPNIRIFAADNGKPILQDSTQFNLKVINSLPSLVCKIEIVRPRGGTSCAAEVEVCVSTTITGTIGTTTKVTTVNGIPVLTGCVKVPLINGPNKIVARLTVKDSLETCVAADSVTVIGRLSPLSCTLNFTAPADSALICSASVGVNGTASIAGGIIPLTSKVDVNGVPATLAGNAFSVLVKLTPGWNTLIATFAVTDSCNNTAVCRDTIRVRSLIDQIAPDCAFTPGYKSVTGMLFDNESGIAKVEAIFLFNAKLTVDPFTPGAKQVKFRLDDLGQEPYLAFDIKITDLCGNTHICDPVFLQLTADRANQPYIFKFRSVDRYFQLQNKGLTEVRVELNGKQFSFSTSRRGGSVQSLGVYAMPAAGEVVLDLQSYLRDNGDNDIRIEIAGPAGSSAELLLINEIHDAEHALALQEVPLAYALSQNYPNPFNPETVIRFGIPAHVTAGTPAAPVGVQLRIYNMLGELVRTLVDQPMQPGSYIARWNGRNERGVQVAAGVYIYRIVAGDYRATKRMLLLK